MRQVIYLLDQPKILCEFGVNNVWKTIMHKNMRFVKYNLF